MLYVFILHTHVIFLLYSLIIFASILLFLWDLFDARCGWCEGRLMYDLKTSQFIRFSIRFKASIITTPPNIKSLFWLPLQQNDPLRCDFYLLFFFFASFILYSWLIPCALICDTIPSNVHHCLNNEQINMHW